MRNYNQANANIYICIYSFFKDAYLSDCLASIINSDARDCFIDLYIYDRKNQCRPNEFNVASNMNVTVSSKLKNFSQVVNASLRKALENNIEYFLLLNSDTIVHPDCIPNLSSALRLDTNIGIIGGYQTKYYSNWNTPNEWTASNVNQNYTKYVSSVNNRILTLYETTYVQGACMMFKTSIVNKIGYFDDRFRLFYEETEFCRRARDNDFFVGILKEAKVKHVSGGTWKKNYFLHLRRDILYLSNQIIFESTVTRSGYPNLFKAVIKISRKQLKNICTKKDHLKMPIWLYPFVWFSILSRLNLLFDLYNNQKNKI